MSSDEEFEELSASVRLIMFSSFSTTSTPLLTTNSVKYLQTTESLRPSIRGSGFIPKELEEETSKWEIDPSEIELGETLGAGTYGSVYKGKLRGKHVAVKKIQPSSMDQSTLDTFRMEVAVMSKLRHPNVLLFMGASIEPDCLMIVTELMPRGSVQDVLKDTKLAKELTFTKRMKMAKDAALGMNWLHLSKPVFIHRDLKSGNLLVDNDFTVKVGDFGLTIMKEVNEKDKFGAIGTPLYMAPEVIMNEPYDESCDVYSFGIVLWEILTGEQPFQHEVTSFEDMVEKVCKQGLRPTIPDSCPKSLRELITRCWDADPKKRPRFQEIVDEFDYIIVEGVVKDPMGIKFWHTHLRGQEKVPFTDFVSKFCSFLNIRPPRRGLPALSEDSTGYQCLEALLSKNGYVTMEAFHDFIQWFGPLLPKPSFLEKVEEMLRHDWFHGDVTTAEAERMLLTSNQPGTFLVRFSSQPGAFTVSSLSRDRTIKMFRITRKGTEFCFGDHTFASLAELLAKMRDQLRAYYPCPNSKYRYIFDPKPSGLAQYMAP